MKIDWKHIGAVLTGVVIPAAAAAIAGRPLTWGVAWQALAAGLTTGFAVFLNSPIVDPGVQK